MIASQKTITSLMREYFSHEQSKNNQESSGKLLNESFETSLPVAVSECNWEIHQSPERFSRKFSFSTKQNVMDFIKEVLSYERSTGHDGTLKIEGLSVTVEVYTHDVNKITELDQEYRRSVNDIYRDVLDFGRY